MALATNGTDSFAVLNYAKLTTNPQLAGMNEHGCGRQREFFSRFNATNTAVAVNVTGVPGRHVYHLTNKSCFEPSYGIRSARHSINIYSLFNTQSTNLRVLKPEETGNVAMSFNEVVEGGYEVPVAPVLFSNPQQSIYRFGEFIVHYGIYHAKTSRSYVYTSNLFILEGTKMNKNFQYGNVTIPNLDSSTMCKSQVFEQAMNSTPTIKVSAMVSGRSWKDYVFVWIKNVTNNGFTACSREIINYSGNRSVSMHYMAATNADSNTQEVNSLIFPASTQIQRCTVKKFKSVFLSTPDVYTSVEVNGNSNAPMVSWVKSVTTRQVEICLRSTRNEQHKVHIIINGQISPCTSHNCPDHLECKVTRDLNPYCGCISSCRGEEQREFCGTDFGTYRSMCELNQHFCQKHGNTTEVNIGIQHYEACQCKFKVKPVDTRCQNDVVWTLERRQNL